MRRAAGQERAPQVAALEDGFDDQIDGGHLVERAKKDLRRGGRVDVDRVTRAATVERGLVLPHRDDAVAPDRPVAPKS